MHDRLYPSGITLQRVGPYLERFGITRVARHTGLDNVGIPVWCAYTPNSKSIVVAQGKGLTDDDAKVSATMEALERAIACDPTVRRVEASTVSLQKAGRQTHPLQELIAQGKELISPDETLVWVEGTDLASERQTLVPFGAVTLDRTIRENRYWQSSDGLASGNTIEEATFHALMERVERDAHALWQLRKLPQQMATCIDPISLGSPEVTRLAEMLSVADLELRLFDITSDVGIPSFTALVGPKRELRQNVARYVEVTYGNGTHPVEGIAAIRAITEAAQSRLTYISGARDDVYREVFERTLPARIRGLFDAEPRRVFIDSNRQQSMDIEAILERLSAVGVADVIRVVLSEATLPFAVVKVVVPGLENPEGARRQRIGARGVAKAIFG